MLRRLVTPTVLTAGLAAAVVTASAMPAAADTPPELPDTQDIVDELEGDGVFIDPSIDQIPAADESALEAVVAGSEVPVYYVILPTGAAGSDTGLNAVMEPVMAEVGDGAYGILAGSDAFRVTSPDIEDTEAVRQIALDEGAGNQIDTLAAVPDAVEQAESDAASGAVSGVVLLAVLVLVVAAGGWFVHNSRKKRAAQKARELAEIRQMATEDVVRLGEDVARLEIDLTAVDEATRADYTRAMDSYDQAKSLLDTISEPDQVRMVTSALEDGRYYMSATRARMSGEPVPERRGPCFFNPQHGPSTEDVTWAPPGGAPRSVTACAACAQAVRTGGQPDVRLVEVGGERRPYYDAGPAYSPYAGGYFGMDMMMGMFTGMMMGSMMGSMLGGGMMGAGDMGDVGDVGGDDFGGGDFGGGDFGGFDF
ncbi:chemotaxis protein CheA [Nocardiopsis sp. EMB25]|uniref:chemotaxis protein CheA n=1 Tax=Nocardiopsis sp. EMB25 TaxID=2835867 RepID=UPI002283454F|nr:chemotaxis protein CheA [Nocardiopsis sp. EMB25]MCY9785790.1 chemotaxis protein CheA [Nocardiopsis sp. EMB25]